MKDLTTEEVRMLADMERKMDRGEQPYVMNRGGRWAVPADTMEQLGLESGQTVSDFLITKILETNIANLTAEIDRMKKAN